MSSVGVTTSCKCQEFTGTFASGETQPEPLRRDCDTVVAASVLCGAISANLPNFVCDSDDY